MKLCQELPSSRLISNDAVSTIAYKGIVQQQLRIFMKFKIKKVNQPKLQIYTDDETFITV
jgi:hypothetical protein